MSGLNSVDVILTSIVLVSTLLGFWRGLFKELFSLAVLAAALMVATIFSAKVAMVLTALPTMQKMLANAHSAGGPETVKSASYIAVGMAYTLLFIGVTLTGSIVGRILNAAIQASLLSFGNRVLGSLFGFLRGIIIDVVIVFVVQLTPVVNEAYWTQSTLVTQLQPLTARLSTAIAPSIEKLKAKLQEKAGSAGAGVTNAAQQQIVQQVEQQVQQQFAPQAAPAQEAPQEAPQSQDTQSQGQ